MASESEFLEKARRILTIYDHLQALFAKGKVTQGRYAKHKESLDRMLTSLRTDNLKMIGEAMVEIEKALQKADTDRNAGVIDENRLLAIRKDLNLKKADLESDRDAMELCQGDDYVTCLRRQIDEKKYENYGGRKHTAKDVLSGNMEMVDSAAFDDDNIPSWAWVIFLLMLVMAFVGGLISGSALLAIVVPIVIIANVAFMTAVVHMSTVAVGVLTASIERAFRCVMMCYVMLFVSAALLLAMLGFALITPQLGWAILVAVWIGLVVLAIFIPIYCVYSAYDSTVLQAILVIILATAISTIVTVLLGMIFSGFLEGLVLTLPHNMPYIQTR
jgi:hypothetical protein